MTAAPRADVASQLSAILADHQVVDLTLPLAEKLPGTWPGHMPFRATVWTWFADRPDDPQPPRGAWFLFLPLDLVDGTGARAVPSPCCLD